MAHTINPSTQKAKQRNLSEFKGGLVCTEFQASQGCPARPSLRTKEQWKEYVLMSVTNFSEYLFSECQVVFQRLGLEVNRGEFVVFTGEERDIEEPDLTKL